MIFLLTWLLLAPAQPLAADGVQPGELSFRRVGEVLEVYGHNVSGRSRKISEYPLIKVDEGAVFFHWADEYSAGKYTSEGRISPEQIAALNKPKKELQSYGPGFYVSAHPYDSRAFGDRSVEIRPGKGQGYILDLSQIEGKPGFPFGNDPEAVFAKLSEQGVWGRKVNSNWYVFHDPRGTADARPFDVNRFLRDWMPKVKELSPGQSAALAKLQKQEPWTLEEMASLFGRGEGNLPESLRKAAVQAIAQQKFPSGDPGRDAMIQIASLRDSLDHATNYNNIRSSVSAGISGIAKSLASLEDPAAVGALRTAFEDTMTRTMGKGELQNSLPASALRNILKLSQGRPELLPDLLGFARWVGPTWLPAAMARLTAKDDHALTEAVAKAIGVRSDLARDFRELLFLNRARQIGSKFTGEALLEESSLTNEEALALLRATAGDNEARFSALKLSGKVKVPGKELIRALLAEALGPDPNLAGAASRILGRNPALYTGPGRAALIQELLAWRRLHEAAIAEKPGRFNSLLESTGVEMRELEAAAQKAASAPVAGSAACETGFSHLKKVAP